MRRVVRMITVALASLIVLFPAVVYGGTLFDDFEEESDFWVVDSGEWKIENGVYHQADIATNGSSGVFSYIEGSNEWGNDFTIEVKLNIQAGTSREVGVIYKWQDINNHFHVMIDESDAMVRINNRAGGWQQNQNIAMPFSLNEWYDLKVIVKENNYRILVDGEEIQEYDREAMVNAGFLGLKTVTSEAFFDDFKVTGPNVPDFGLSVECAGKLAAIWGRIKCCR
jgi:hypothetical protein